MARRKKPELIGRDHPHLVEARDRFRSASNNDTQRTEWRIDEAFKALEQWDSNIKASRLAEGRPVLTFDQIGPALRQICNQQRSASPSVKIIPRGHGANQETALIFEGVCRQVQDLCHAQLAYDWAFECAASLGLGWARLLTAYDEDDPRDQVIQIKRVLNTAAVYPDPASTETNFSDMRYLFYITDYPIGEYRRRWPDSRAATLDDWGDTSDLKEWFPDKAIRVAEYWYIQEQSTPGAIYSDGQVYADDDPAIPEGVTKTDQARQVTTRTVCCDFINGFEVLEHQQWPGKYIPWMPAIGEEYWYQGRRMFRGLYRAARDPQRTYNYERTNLTETLALSKSPDYLADADQIEPFRAIWEQRTTRNLGYLPYKTTTVNGQLVPPPIFNSKQPAIEGNVLAINLAKQDLRSTTSWYDPTDPSRKNTDQSGRAIRARFEETTVGNSHYLDNFTQISLRWLGVLLIDLIPKIYDRPGRVVRIVGRDDQEQMVMLNQPFQKGPDGTPQAIEQGQPGMGTFYQLGAGTYDVTVSVGGSTSTRRQEFVENGFRLMEVLQPQAPMFADLVVSNMDDAGSQQIAARLKKLLPPELQDGNAQDPKLQVQKLQQQMQQMGQMLDLVTKELNQRVDQIKTDQTKTDGQVEIKKFEIASKERIEAARMQLDAGIALAKIDAQRAAEQLKLLQSQLDGLQTHEREMEAQAQGEQHEREMAMLGHDQALEQQAQGGEIAMAQAAQQAALQPPPEAGA